MNIIAAIVFLLTAELAFARTLDTDHFRIVINCLKYEEDAGCVRASYDSKNKQTGSAMRLMGKQLMQSCKEKLTPCPSRGYEFTNGQIIYFISEDGHLKVTDGSKVLIDEVGEWTYE